MQAAFSSREMDPVRTRFLLAALAASPKIQKILIEPHLKIRLGIRSPKVRFQGCRAARHDDHIHAQVF
jgi:hypothetical protein